MFIFGLTARPVKSEIAGKKEAGAKPGLTLTLPAELPKQLHNVLNSFK
jgi:hypothetical protein